MVDVGTRCGRNMRGFRRADRILTGGFGGIDLVLDLAQLGPGANDTRDRVLFGDGDGVEAKDGGTARVILRVGAAGEEGEIGGDGQFSESHVAVCSHFVPVWESMCRGRLPRARFFLSTTSCLPESAARTTGKRFAN